MNTWQPIETAPKDNKGDYLPRDYRKRGQMGFTVTSLLVGIIIIAVGYFKLFGIPVVSPAERQLAGKPGFVLVSNHADVVQNPFTTISSNLPELRGSSIFSYDHSARITRPLINCWQLRFFPNDFVSIRENELGVIYWANNPRLGPQSYTSFRFTNVAYSIFETYSMLRVFMDKSKPPYDQFRAVSRSELPFGNFGLGNREFYLLSSNARLLPANSEQSESEKRNKSSVMVVNEFEDPEYRDNCDLVLVAALVGAVAGLIAYFGNLGRPVKRNE